MKVTSNAHQDGHAALLHLVEEALTYQHARLEVALSKLATIKSVVDVNSSLPWYKRAALFASWFNRPSTVLTDLDVEDAELTVEFIKSNIQFLQTLKCRAQYELSIELNGKETDLLFCGVSSKC